MLSPYLRLTRNHHTHFFSKLKSNGVVIGKCGFARVSAARNGWHKALSTLMRFDASNTNMRLSRSIAFADAFGKHVCNGYASHSTLNITIAGPKSSFATTSRADCFWMHFNA